MSDYIRFHDAPEEYTAGEISQLRNVMGCVRGFNSAYGMPLPELIERGHACDMARSDAVDALDEMITVCGDLIKQIQNPDEPHDERKPFGYQGWLSGEYERVIIELANLADVRNTHKIQR